MNNASAPGLNTKPSMNELKHDNYDPFNYANLKNVDPLLAAQISEACEKKFLGKSLDIQYLFIHFDNIVDVDPNEWAEIYKLKLKFCYRHANFQADPKKNPEQAEFKEQKREILIELIDILDDHSAVDHLLNVEILADSMEMIEKNIFRTF